MNKFMSWLEDSFVPKANKLFSRPFIAAFFFNNAKKSFRLF